LSRPGDNNGSVEQDSAVLWTFVIPMVSMAYCLPCFLSSFVVDFLCGNAIGKGWCESLGRSSRFCFFKSPSTQHYDGQKGEEIGANSQ